MMLETKHFTVNPRKGKNREPDFHQRKVLITVLEHLYGESDHLEMFISQRH